MIDRVFSSAYPIIHKIEVAENDLGKPIYYDIYIRDEDDDRTIFSGVVIPTDFNDIEIDISPICREHLDTHHQRIIEADASSATYSEEGVVDIITFEVRDDKSGDLAKEYTVKYDYNTEYYSQLSRSDMMNCPILFEIDPRQFLFPSLYLTGKDDGMVQVIINGVAKSSTHIPDINNSVGFKIDLDEYYVDERDTVEIRYVINKISRVLKYKVINPCKNNFVIHYVNTKGGLDSLLVSGKSVVSYESDPNIVELGYKRHTEASFHSQTLENKVVKRYELNTSIISEHNTHLIDELVGSPKIWVEDLDKGVLISVIMEGNTAQPVKNHKNDKVVNYKFNFRESKKYIRK